MKVSSVSGNIEGQTLVEFALIVTLLLALLFGITEFGRGWYYSNALVNGARAGARYASELKTPDANYETKVQNYTFKQISSAIPIHARTFLNHSGNPSVSISAFDKATGNSKALSSVGRGDAVQVTVQYSFDVLTGSIIPYFSGTKQLTRSATMYYEGS